jgi:hypothetical protein
VRARAFLGLRVLDAAQDLAAVSRFDLHAVIPGPHPPLRAVRLRLEDLEQVRVRDDRAGADAGRTRLQQQQRGSRAFGERSSRRNEGQETAQQQPLHASSLVPEAVSRNSHLLLILHGH